MTRLVVAVGAFRSAEAGAAFFPDRRFREEVSTCPAAWRSATRRTHITDMSKMMAEAGAPPTKAEFYERTGWRQPEEDEEVLEIAQPAGGDPFGGMMGGGGGSIEAAAQRGAEAALRAMRPFLTDPD